MKRYIGVTIMFLMIIFIMPLPSQGAVVIGNQRPVAVSPGVGGGQNLQDILDPFNVNAISDQEMVDYFTLPTGTISSEFSILFSYFTNSSAVVDMGLYNKNNPSQELLIFDDEVAPQSVTPTKTFGVVFNAMGKDGYVVSADFTNPFFPVIIDQVTGWAGDYIFGFFAKPSNSPYTFYLDDEMNIGGSGPGMAYDGTSAYGLAYRVDQGYVFAFDFNKINFARDFNDLVFRAQSISPVPEPGTVFMIGAGLIGLSFLKRKKKFRQM